MQKYSQIDIAKELHAYLVQVSKEINEKDMITDDYQVILGDLDQLLALIISTGDQFLSKEQIQTFMQEIMNLKEQIRVINYQKNNDMDAAQQLHDYLVRTGRKINKTV